jgi:hypothetical protein
VRDELRSGVDSLPGMAWTALSDGHIDFVNQPWATAEDGSGARFSFSIPAALQGATGPRIPGVIQWPDLMDTPKDLRIP